MNKDKNEELFPPGMIPRFWEYLGANVLPYCDKPAECLTEIYKEEEEYGYESKPRGSARPWAGASVRNGESKAIKLPTHTKEGSRGAMGNTVCTNTNTSPSTIQVQVETKAVIKKVNRVEPPRGVNRVQH